MDEEKIALIDSYAGDYLVWLEYGLQSVHNSSLEYINQGHDFKAFEDAMALSARRPGIN